jgi:type IV secretory pathway TraG/TraD family ATPase VirD4
MGGIKTNQAFKGSEIWWNDFQMTLKMHFKILLLVLFLQITIFLVFLKCAMRENAFRILPAYCFSRAVQSLGFNPSFEIRWRDEGTKSERTIRTNAATLTKLPQVKSYVDQEIWKIYLALFLSCSAYLSYSFAYRFFKNKSKKIHDIEHIRGPELIEEEELFRQVKSENKSCNLPLGSMIRLPVEYEPEHIFVAGKTRVGKTVCLSQMVHEVREKNCKAIVYDFKGSDFLAKHYDPGRDIILNPLDVRSHFWDLFAEMKSVPDIIAVASSIVPPAKGETFFNDNARKVFKSAVICLVEKGRGTIEDSWKLFTSPIKEITELLKGSPLGAEGYVSIQDHSSKQALGVISVLMQYCGFFEYLANQDKSKKFTIDEWIGRGEGGFIYLVNREECTDTLRPFISLFVDLMAKKLLSMSDDPGRRIYMFLDEFGTLQMLPSILRLAIAGGSKGCVLVIGIQDFAQISKIYGPEKAESLFNSCGTAVIFNVVDPKTARFFAERIGEREFKEISETISMGLTDSRDGRSLTKGRKRELVILPSEIQSLKKREAYVKFPEHNPVLLKVEITKANRLPDVTEPFIMRPGLTLESIIKRQEEISIKASALTEGVEISEEPDGSRQKTEVLQNAAKETMENDFPVENESAEDWNNT